MFTLLGRRAALRYGSTLFDVQGLKKNKIYSIGDKKVWEK